MGVRDDGRMDETKDGDGENAEPPSWVQQWLVRTPEVYIASIYRNEVGG